MDLDSHALVTRLRGIYAIVNENERDALAIARAALEGGVRIIQYRAKRGIVAANARALRDLTREYGALFILNDDWRAVETYDADGVHVGPDDAQSHEMTHIRNALSGRILGVSCGTEDEARAAEASGADYIGVGSVYATGSKADAGDPIGIAGLTRVSRSTTLPVAAIGGIAIASLADVRATGVAMAAVISAISGAQDPRLAASMLVSTWNA